MKKFVSLFLVVAMLMSVAMLLVSCAGSGECEVCGKEVTRELKEIEVEGETFDACESCREELEELRKELEELQ